MNCNSYLRIGTDILERQLLRLTVSDVENYQLKLLKVLINCLYLPKVDLFLQVFLHQLLLLLQDLKSFFPFNEIYYLFGIPSLAHLFSATSKITLSSNSFRFIHFK